MSVGEFIHVCALTLLISALGLLMGKFCQFLTELSAHYTSFFSFLDITLVNINQFSPNLECALILWRAGLRLLISSVFDSFSPTHDSGGVLLFHFCYRKYTCI